MVLEPTTYIGLATTLDYRKDKLDWSIVAAARPVKKLQENVRGPVVKLNFRTLVFKV